MSLGEKPLALTSYLARGELSDPCRLLSSRHAPARTQATIRRTQSPNGLSLARSPVGLCEPKFAVTSLLQLVVAFTPDLEGNNVVQFPTLTGARGKDVVRTVQVTIPSSTQ